MKQTFMKQTFMWSFILKYDPERTEDVNPEQLGVTAAQLSLLTGDPHAEISHAERVKYHIVASLPSPHSHSSHPLIYLHPESSPPSFSSAPALLFLLYSCPPPAPLHPPLHPPSSPPASRQHKEQNKENVWNHADVRSWGRHRGMCTLGRLLHIIRGRASSWKVKWGTLCVFCFYFIVKGPRVLVRPHVVTWGARPFALDLR